METRAAAKRKATAAAAPMVVVQKQHPKRQRVVLGELSNFPNATQNKRKEKLQCRKNPNLKKPSPTEFISSSSQFDQPYVFDIYEYLHGMEMQKKRRPMIDYIEKVQGEVTVIMRTILVNWLVEVAEEYNLHSDTLHLSVSYIDRFLSANPVSKSRLQLLGVSAMLIAAKYDEVDPPRVDAFCNITDNTYKKAEVVKMEADILKSLKFEMGNPTVNTFLRRFVDVACDNQKASNLQFEFLSCYLADLSLLDYDCLRILPSIVAASAVFLARFIIAPEVHPWTSSLSECSGYKPVELKECVMILHDLYFSRKAVREKYKQHKFKFVARLPSPPHIPSHYFETQ